MIPSQTDALVEISTRLRHLAADPPALMVHDVQPRHDNRKDLQDASVSGSMPEVATLGEDHRRACGLDCGDDFRVAL